MLAIYGIISGEMQQPDRKGGTMATLMYDKIFMNPDYLESTKDGFVPRVEVRKLTKKLELLIVDPRTAITQHGHPAKVWEIYAWLDESTNCFVARICLPGEEHDFINDSDHTVAVWSIKGTVDIAPAQVLREYLTKTLSKGHVTVLNSVISDDILGM